MPRRASRDGCAPPLPPADAGNEEAPFSATVVGSLDMLLSPMGLVAILAGWFTTERRLAWLLQALGLKR